MIGPSDWWPAQRRGLFRSGRGHEAGADLAGAACWVESKQLLHTLQNGHQKLTTLDHLICRMGLTNQNMESLLVVHKNIIQPPKCENLSIQDKTG